MACALLPGSPGPVWRRRYDAQLSAPCVLGSALPRRPTLTEPGDRAGVAAPALSDNLGLDAVLRVPVVLLEAEQAVCNGGPRGENSQVRIHPNFQSENYTGMDAQAR
jgi:hypothetical protein